jgi:hypothetical protein
VNNLGGRDTPEVQGDEPRGRTPHFALRPWELEVSRSDLPPDAPRRRLLQAMQLPYRFAIGIANGFLGARIGEAIGVVVGRRP